MKTYLLPAIAGAIIGLAIGTLDGMTDRTLATGLGLAGIALALIALAKWVK
jgi:type III secretory pathway component EscS